MLPFGAQFSLGGTFIAWRGATGFYGAYFGSCSQIQEWRQKKVFSERLFVFFVLKQNFFTHAWGHKQYFGGAQVPKCTPVAPGCYFFGGTIFAWGAKAVIWAEHGLEMPPPPRGDGPETLPLKHIIIYYATTTRSSIIQNITTVSKLRLANVNFVALVLNRTITKKIKILLKNLLSRV